MTVHHPKWAGRKNTHRWNRSELDHQQEMVEAARLDVIRAEKSLAHAKDRLTVRGRMLERHRAHMKKRGISEEGLRWQWPDPSGPGLEYIVNEYTTGEEMHDGGQ